MRDRYDIQETWEWNLQHSPETAAVEATTIPGEWTWCGIPVHSPLGVPAGPLLNSDWLLFYANRGFDILVYKTVRTVAHSCYELPNLVPVSTGPLTHSGGIVPATDHMDGSWAVSFGMPSQAPDVWRKDVETARHRLAEKQALVVSVVGTQTSSETSAECAIEALAVDFAKCAQWAVESGAHGVEANFSCPNVDTADGQLFQQPDAAGKVAATIRAAIGDTPLVLKIGKIETGKQAAELLQHVGPSVNGLAMTNSIAARVKASDGDLLFGGQNRGICGDATRQASIRQVELFREAVDNSPFSIDLIGVGGVSATRHVQEYLAAGADSVAMATSAMVNPDVALTIKADWEASTARPAPKT